MEEKFVRKETKGGGIEKQTNFVKERDNEVKGLEGKNEVNGIVF